MSIQQINFISTIQVKYYRDTYAEHPDDRVNIEYTVPLENDEALVTINGVYDQVKGDHEFEEFRYVNHVVVYLLNC